MRLEDGAGKKRELRIKIHNGVRNFTWIVPQTDLIWRQTT